MFGSVLYIIFATIIKLGNSEYLVQNSPINETTEFNDDPGAFSTIIDDIERAVRKATDYILQERQSNHGWGTSRARAVVALMFARQIRSLDDDEINLIKKELTIQLYLDLMEEQTMSASHLALSINALYAMCEDPRSFHGMNLVKLLRTKVDDRSKPSTPLVLLTLCIAGESHYNDLVNLTAIYNSREKYGIGTKALTLMTLYCLQRSDKTFTKSSNFVGLLRSYEKDFFSTYQHLENSSFDIYNKALYIQVANSARISTLTTSLLKDQYDDGSFGDLLATYYAIPALLRISLLHLKCEDVRRENSGNELKSPLNGKNVSLSIWMTSDGIPNSHSMALTCDEDDSLHDLLRKAEYTDKTFEFMWERNGNKLEVYGVAGIPNDPEAGKQWTLYSGKRDKIRVNSKQGLHKETEGIELKPKENTNYIFWWE